jgi:hypothetical protein
VAFLVWARIERTWPFGPKVIREEFLDEQRATLQTGTQTTA